VVDRLHAASPPEERATTRPPHEYDTHLSLLKIIIETISARFGGRHFDPSLGAKAHSSCFFAQMLHVNRVPFHIDDDLA
jgi:hypothetical protein